MIADFVARADDALVLGHRLSEFCSFAPSMEEDMALANLALDLIGQARALYQFAAEAEGQGKTEDDYAYFRDADAFRNLLITEQENGDFAQTIIRHLLYAGFAELYWRARASQPPLASLAERFAKELAYHWRHAADWTLRLGDGTAESHSRAQSALDRLWPYTGEMFMDEDAAALHQAWRGRLDPVLAEASLSIPGAALMRQGGRRGLHSEAFSHMLAEMQSLARAHPAAVW